MAARRRASGRAERGRSICPAGVQSLAERSPAWRTAGTCVQRRSGLGRGITVARPEATGHEPSADGAGARRCVSASGRRPGERQREGPVPANHAMRGEGREIEERARREVDGAPAGTAALGEIVGQVRGSARAHGWADRDRAMALELHPERIHAAVVVQAHPLASPAVHEEEERGFLAECAQESHPDGGHQPSDAREHLVRLWKVDGGALGERAAEVARVPRAVVATLGHDVKRHTGTREGETVGPAGYEAPPVRVARRQHERRSAETAPTAGKRRVAGHPRRERRADGARGVSHRRARAWGTRATGDRGVSAAPRAR